MYNTAFKVLEVLEESEGPVSGEQISGKLGISRSAVWKHIKELKGMGYEIEASQKEGYRLTKKSNRLLPYEVHKRLRTNFIGKKMRYYENTPSTIWVGKQLATEGDAEKINGMVIIAEEQTGGIGRLGRSWVSPAGGVWITIVLKPEIPIDRVFMVTMAGSVAVARAIRKEFDLGALIKWPNDIYIGDKKVAGLLLELYAEAFEEAGALDRLEAFASFHGADFYGLPRNTRTVTLEREDWTVPAEIDFGGMPGVPLRAGETLAWRLKD